MSVDEDLVKELDRKVGRRRRSGFIAAAIRRALDDDSRWKDILGALGKIPDRGHDWDPDPGAWVREQRRGGMRRVG